MRRLLIGVTLSFLFGVGTLAACSDDDSGAKCGDGVMNGQEVCDGADLGGHSCADLGFEGGTLACAEDCTFDTSGCTGGSACGNGVVDQGEDCDGSDLNGASCQSEGFDGGTLSCDTSCKFDTTGCTGGSDCGNGVVDTGEECDGSDFENQSCADLGFQGGDLACNSDCTLDLTGCTGGCGNGQVETGEDCDGTNLEGATCETLGYDSGTLACSDQCLFDVSNCQGGGGAVGDPCTKNEDCTSGQCFPEVAQPDGQNPGVGLPGGYCMDACQQDGTCTDPNAICVSAGLSQFCAKACDPNAPQCRDGYGCTDIGNGQGVCWGACTDDAQCTITNNCDTDANSDSVGFCLTPPEDCSNGVDDDFDGKADCSDMDCNGTCPSGEICDNGIDDDNDGLADCEDGECLQHVACTGISCSPDAALNCDDALTGQSNSQANSTNTIIDWCGAGYDQWTGPEYTWQLTVDANTFIHVGVANLQADLDLIVMRDDGSQGCNPLQCLTASMNLQPDDGDSEDATFEANPGYTYYIAVDGWEGATTTFDLSVDCTPGEVCNDTIDNDNDGLIDCGDPSCFGQAGCTTESLCADGMDNDADGATDCDDTDDCSADPFCSANKTVLLDETFDTWPPTDWTIEDGSDDNNTWMQCDNCGRDINNMDGPFAICDSDGAGQNVTMSEGLVTPSFDASAAATVWLEFDHYFKSVGDTDFAYVELSTDGGSTWSVVKTFTETYQGKTILDLSSDLAGQADCKIRFRYEDGGDWLWYWAIDNVKVTSL